MSIESISQNNAHTEDGINPAYEVGKEGLKPAQKFSDRLAEYIIGLKPGDPKIIDRLIEDQKIIRVKYGLPSYRDIPSLTGYEAFLKRIAEENRVKIMETSTCSEFFRNQKKLRGMYMEEQKKIFVDIDRDNEDTYRKNLRVLEHETIHALQHKRYPNMPIELQEYEAYIAGGDMEYLRSNPIAVESLFGILIGGSVLFWYTNENKHRVDKIKPEWED